MSALASQPAAVVSNTAPPPKPLVFMPGCQDPGKDKRMVSIQIPSTYSYDSIIRPGLIIFKPFETQLVWYL